LQPQRTTTWIDAVNAGVLGTLNSLMTEDVVFLNPGREFSGRNDFPADFSGAHQTYRIRCVSKLHGVTAAGDVAYTVSRDSLSLTPWSGGNSIELTGHRITIYRKQHDGRWLLARDAHMLAPGKR